MVGKKIRNPAIDSSKSQRVAGLVNYIVSPENSNESEKCIYSGNRGFFLAETHEARRAEMIALTEDSVKSKDPINHYVLSWREGERPTPEQVEVAIDILLDELGLQQHQAIYGVHSDTNNLHMHIAVNRVHPETLKVILPNKGFDIEAVHKALARIEHAQGWQREDNGRYVVLENGSLARELTAAGKQREPSQRKRDMENRTGEKSAERIAIEQAGPIIKEAKSWQEIHAKLAEIDIRYERFGSGAKIFIGDIGVKASNVDRAVGFTKLEKRLGPYLPSTQEKPHVYIRHEPTSEPHFGNPANLSENGLRKLSECRLAYNGKGKTQGVLSLNARAHRRQPEGVRREPTTGGRQIGPQPIRQDTPGWNEYIGERQAHYKDKKEATLALRRAQEAERKDLAASQKSYRDDLFKNTDWHGKGVLLNSLRSVEAANQAAEKITLRERQKQERAQLRAQFLPFPDFEEWLKQINQPDLADQWRNRAKDPGVIEGEATEPPTSRDIRSFVPQVYGYQVHYTLKVNAGQVGAATAFIDSGKRVYVNDWQNRDTVLAALQLSAQKWGRFQITGSDTFKAQCVELAAEYGFKIINPDLQESIGQERQRLQQDRAEAIKSVEVKEFEKYHEAIGADRYQIMTIKTYPNGKQQAFLLDKKDALQGITSEEIARRTPGIKRLQRRGENLFFTPLSEKKYHIVIDDLSREKLDKFLADGFKPAVVLERSPDRYQAIGTVPKLFTDQNGEIAKRLTEQLNKEYGNPLTANLNNSGLAPGHENRKAEYQRDDGSYPKVRIISAEKCECKKSLQMAGVIAGEMKREGQKNPHLLPRTRGIMAAPGSTEDTYQRHLKDVLEDNRREGRVMDISRVDSMVAVRMRVTGHSQADIEGAIRKCGPAIQGKAVRNWEDYAKRTGEFAFGAAGLRQAANVEKDRERLMKIEGREFVPQPKQFHVPEPGEVGKAGKLKKENEKGKERGNDKDKGMER